MKILILTLLFIPLLACAQDNIEIPDKVLQGLDRYSTVGPDSASQKWFEDGAQARNVSAKKTLSEELQQARSLLGRFRNYELLQVRRLGVSNQIVYMSLNHERGSVFISFLVSDSKRGLIINRIKVSTDPEDILPQFIW